MNVARQLAYTSKNFFHSIATQARINSIITTARVARGVGYQGIRRAESRTRWTVALINRFKHVFPKSSLNTMYIIPRRFVSNTSSKIQFTVNNVNKKVTENILVFSNENDSFYKFLSFFGVFQMVLWGYLSLSPVQNLSTGPVTLKKEDLLDMPWWKRWLYKEGQYKNAISGIFLTVGSSILFVSLAYPRRAIKSLWLLKGGNHIKITTHSPFKNSQSFNVPLNNVNCLQARTGGGTQIPLKVKDKAFFFLMDKQGTFHHPEIFDFVIGLQRNL